MVGKEEASREEFINSIVERSKKDDKLVAGDKVVLILGDMLPNKKTSLTGIYEVE